MLFNFNLYPIYGQFRVSRHSKVTRSTQIRSITRKSILFKFYYELLISANYWAFCIIIWPIARMRSNAVRSFEMRSMHSIRNRVTAVLLLSFAADDFPAGRTRCHQKCLRARVSCRVGGAILTLGRWRHNRKPVVILVSIRPRGYK